MSELVVCVAVALLVTTRIAAPSLAARRTGPPARLRAPPLLVAARAPVSPQLGTLPLRL